MGCPYWHTMTLQVSRRQFMKFSHGTVYWVGWNITHMGHLLQREATS
jgi:hypothetical protein